jgi:hypothetical protein
MVGDRPNSCLHRENELSNLKKSEMFSKERMQSNAAKGFHAIAFFPRILAGQLFREAYAMVWNFSFRVFRKQLVPGGQKRDHSVDLDNAAQSPSIRCKSRLQFKKRTASVGLIDGQRFFECNWLSFVTSSANSKLP